MPRTSGAISNRVFRIKFTDTDSGHNWYMGPYTSRRSTRALRTRKVREMNADPKRDGKKPIEGDVEPGRVRWGKDDGSD